MKRTLIHIHHTLWVTAVIFIVLTAVVLGSLRLISPLLSRERPAIEHWASVALQKPISIGSLGIVWYRLTPVLKCANVVIYDPQHTHPLLEVGEFDVGFSVLDSLFSGRFRLNRLRVADVQIHVQETATGSYLINGLHTKISGSVTPTDSATLKEILSWFLTQQQITLQNFSLDWNALSGKKFLFDNIDVSLRNNAAHHLLWGQINLFQKHPSALGFVLNINGNPQDFSKIKAKIYLTGKEVHLKQWLGTTNFSNVTVAHGTADFQIWANWNNNQLRNVRSEFSLDHLQLVSAKSVFMLPKFAGNLFWHAEKNQGWQLLGNHLQIEFADHHWPEDQLAIAMLPGNNGQASQQFLQIDYLYLQDLAPLFTLGTLFPADIQQKIQALRPAGELSNLNFFYQPAVGTQPSNFAVNTHFNDLAIQHWEKVPGVKQLSGYVQVAPMLGALDLYSQNPQLDFGNLFRAPLNLQQLNGHIAWQHDPQGWTFTTKQLIAGNADIVTQTEASLEIPDNKTSPILSVLTGFQLNNSQRLADYLPHILSPGLVEWLSQSIVSLQTVQGTCVINGQLANFPFEQHDGKFIIDSTLRDLNLAYWPKWPPLQHLSGELLFAARHMLLKASSAQILTIPLQELQATIPLMKKDVPAILTIQTAATAQLKDGLEFLHDSPLQRLLHGEMHSMQAIGPMQLQLGLIVPLEKHDKAPIKVNGKMTTQNATLILPTWNLQITQLQGTLNFTEDSMLSNDLTAFLWNKPITIQFGKTKDGNATQITLNGNVAMTDLQKQFKNSFLDQLSGATDYRASFILNSKPGNDQLNIESNLKGVKVNLAAPLAKSANEAVPFNFNLHLGSAGAPQQMLIHYRDLSATINEQINGWLLGLSSSYFDGQVLLPKNKAGEIQANFKYITLNPTNMDTSVHVRPEDVPYINFTCNDFRYGTKHFGTVQFSLVPIAQGLNISNLRATAPGFNLVAEGSWYESHSGQVSTLSGTFDSQNVAIALSNLGFPSGLIAKKGEAKFSLNWLGTPYDPQYFSMNGTFNLNVEQGEIANIGQNAPNALEMSIGHLITLTSWQSIARRLQLNFSDLTTQNFSFDILKGDFILQNGNAVTTNTYLDGPVARVTISGRIGLATQDYDLRLGISPHISSSLSLLASFAGGPVVGVATTAATWAVGKLFGSEIAKITADSYTVQGSWAKPVVTKTSGL